MGTLRFFEEVVSFKIRRTFGFADYTRRIADAGAEFFSSLFVRWRKKAIFVRLMKLLVKPSAEPNLFGLCRARKRRRKFDAC